MAGTISQFLGGSQWGCCFVATGRVVSVLVRGLGELFCYTSLWLGTGQSLAGMTRGGGMTRGMIYDRFVDIRRVAMPMRLIRNLENTVDRQAVASRSEGYVGRFSPEQREKLKFQDTHKRGRYKFIRHFLSNEDTESTIQPEAHESCHQTTSHNLGIDSELYSNQFVLGDRWHGGSCDKRPFVLPESPVLRPGQSRSLWRFRGGQIQFDIMSAMPYNIPEFSL